ncbi:uracil-xanthine permease [Nonomuraea maritima]|uniref:Uracil-xanthine permease n=1 Tax=Nonomuraea maritima TaxID=683260 RepID=A0A1G9G0U1_9ACTN|nr:solute carrier family 23 protein [Nonomuraea maritima]SDK94177.1 uracil-xanthine permease [Nonomuraea maritima]
MALGWKLHGDGKHLTPGEVVKPDERLSWPLMVGIGAQHVIAMFGATFVFPLVMGLDANLAVMMSGVATILFLLFVKGKVPSYVGSSASFVGAVVAIRAAGGGDATVTGALLAVGVALVVCGYVIHRLGVGILHRVFPPVVTGGVVMLIGFGMAYVAADVYWPKDPWVALLTMAATFVFVGLFRGFLGRIGVLLGLVFGFLLSWGWDLVGGPVLSPDDSGKMVEHFRVDLHAVAQADWIGLPSLHGPVFEASAVVLVLPVVIALIAENVGHVKAVGEMTGADVDGYMGRAVMADGVGTVVSTAVGGPATTTYAENIGVMAATKVYSTAAYYVAAVIAILFGLCPKFGALVAATPGGVLGGVTTVLYGMIGMLGAKIWIENRVNLSSPVNLVPIGAGIICAIGPVALPITGTFSLSGIALGTIVLLAGYHVLRAARRRDTLPATPDAAATTEPTARP